MKRVLVWAILLCLLVTVGAGAEIEYSFADREAGVAYMMSNEDYYAGFSQNDLDYKMQKKGAGMEEYLAFAREQVMDFTEEEKTLIDQGMAWLEKTLTDRGLSLPALDPVVFIRTTMQEEKGAGAYTHGTQIYIGEYVDREALDEVLLTVLAHELFHCMTRSDPQFRKDMYGLIHFAVQDEEYALPDSVFQAYISNPDVEHHNACATFIIDGQPVDCFAALVTRKGFEQPGDSFFDCMVTALVPVDGRDVWYAPEDAENFDEVFGRNTWYVIDPEECMADNFADAIVYGLDGKEYPNPEIIESILDYLAYSHFEPNAGEGITD